MARYRKGALTSWYRSKMAQVDAGVDDALEEAGSKGEEMMKYLIMTRGTGRLWSHPWGPNNREGSFPGRVDTGKMLDAVGHRVLKLGGKSQLRMGWTSGTREDYFLAQNVGFTHNLTGQTIEGMYALDDATDYMYEELRRRLKALGH